MDYKQKTKILFVQQGKGVGGAKISLESTLKHLPSHFQAQVVLSHKQEKKYLESINNLAEKVHFQFLPSWIARKKRSVINNTISFLYGIYQGGYLRSLVKLIFLIRREDINIVYTNNIATPLGAIAAWFTRKPHIWHIRESFGKNTHFRLLVNDFLAVRMIEKLSTQVICNSSYTSTIFERYQKPFIVVSNGVDYQIIQNGAEQGKLLRKDLGIAPDEFVIAMVGNIRSAAKEHLLFLQALESLPLDLDNVRFLIFGGSLNFDVSNYARSVKKVADDLDFGERLIWVDYLDNVPAIMHSFDLLVHPTASEGSGRVIMEAMAAGKPVIGIDEGGVSELIINNTGLLVRPRQADLLAESIILIYKDSPMRETLAKNAELYARDNFEIQNNQEKINNILFEVFNAKEKTIET